MISNSKCVLSLLQITKIKKNVRTLSRVKLAEVGKLQKPRTSALPYDTGQVFLHKLFGFRGVVLFPWTTKVYERSADQQNKTSNSKLNSSSSEQKLDENFSPSTSTQTYYQVLIDERDIKHDRFKSFGHTISEDGSRMIAIQGLEAVSHEDILPYNSTESELFRHHYLSKLLKKDVKKESCLLATDKLEEWKKRYLPWLELTDVNKETTQNVCVTFMPFYMGCTETTPNIYWWRYVIRLQNLTDETVTLRERDWSVYTNIGGKLLHKYKGKGVVGEEPVLSKVKPVFQYSSHVNNELPSGHMWGQFTMEKDNGEMFSCRVPPCMLESKRDENVDPTVMLFRS